MAQALGHSRSTGIPSRDGGQARLRWRRPRRGVAGVELGASDVELGLELGDAQRSPRRRGSSASSRRGPRSAPSGSARSARRASALSLRVASAARRWAERQGRPRARRSWSARAGRSAPACRRRTSACSVVRARREVAVGLGLLGPVAAGVAAGLHELGVGDPGGGRAERDAEDGGGGEETGHEPPRTAPMTSDRRDVSRATATVSRVLRCRRRALGEDMSVRLGRRSSSFRTRHARSRSSAATTTTHARRRPRRSERTIRCVGQLGGDAEPAHGVPEVAAGHQRRRPARTRGPAPAG